MPRYAIFKATGGLAHLLTSLNSVISICETEKRDLIIDSEKCHSFSLPFSTFFVIDDLTIKYYDKYDILDQSVSICDKSFSMIKDGYSKYNPNDDNYYFLDVKASTYYNPNYAIVLFAEYFKAKKKFNIKVNDDILKLLKNEELINKPYISIHFRNTDMKNDINLFIKQFEEIYNKTKINTLYIASDYFETYDIFVNKFPDVKIIRKTVPPSGIDNLHYCALIDKFDQLYQCIVDILYIAHSNYFIPSYNSGLSRLMIDQINNDCPLIPGIESKTIVL